MSFPQSPRLKAPSIDPLQKRTFGAGRSSVAALEAAPAVRTVIRACPEAGMQGGGHGSTSALLSQVSPGKLSPGPAEAEHRAKARNFVRVAGGPRLPRASLPEFERAVHKQYCNERASLTSRDPSAESGRGSGKSRIRA